MKTAISLPDQIFEAAEELAQRLGVSRSQLYASAVANFVELNRTTRVTELLDQVYSADASAIEDGPMALQLDALPDENW